MAAELYRSITGTDILHVPYKSSSGARNDLIGGHVRMMFDDTPSVAPNVLAGSCVRWAQPGRGRSAVLPDVPTLAEAGAPGYQHTGWTGIMAPTGTPKGIIELLNVEINKLLSKPEVKEALARDGSETMPISPAEFDAYLRAEIAKWTTAPKTPAIKHQLSKSNFGSWAPSRTRRSS